MDNQPSKKNIQDLIKPTRPRRVMIPEYDKDFIDREEVPQPDGSLCAFKWKPGADGWEFSNFIDSQGFTIYEESDQSGEIARLLIKSEIAISEVDDKTETPNVGDNETLHGYRYGGLLSMRRGYYITPKDDNKRVLKVKLVALS